MGLKAMKPRNLPHQFKPPIVLDSTNFMPSVYVTFHTDSKTSNGRGTAGYKANKVTGQRKTSREGGGNGNVREGDAKA